MQCSILYTSQDENIKNEYIQYLIQNKFSITVMKVKRYDAFIGRYRCMSHFSPLVGGCQATYNHVGGVPSQTNRQFVYYSK